MLSAARVFTLIFLAGCQGQRSAADLSEHNLPDGFIANEMDLSQANLIADLAGQDLVPADLSKLPLEDLLTAAADLTAPVADASVGGLVPGETCAQAAPLVSGLEYTGQSSLGLADDYHIGILSNGTCNFNNNVYHAPDATYSISVPNGKTLVVQVFPENAVQAWDPAIALVTDCANGASCLAGHDDTNLTGDTETVSWTNSTGAAVAVFVIVDSYLGPGHDSGNYRILAVLQ